MKYKDDWDQAKKRLEAFWNGEITDRCCVAATGLRTGHTYKEFPLPETEEGRKQYWTCLLYTSIFARSKKWVL